MSGRLAGKVAVITGAGSGIGAATAEAFVREGAKVVAADISGGQEDVAKRLGESCLAVHADVTKGSDIQSMLAVAVDSFGGLDILHNNAGIDGAVAPTGEMGEDEFDRVWSINGRGVWLGMHYAIPLMLERGGGSIINTASIASLVGFPGMSGYCAAKGAVLMITKTAAAEYAGQGIRVNAICPGPIRTGITDSLPKELIDGVVAMTPLGRFGATSEVADLAVFLASSESSFITGSAIVIDGGYTTL